MVGPESVLSALGGLGGLGGTKVKVNQNSSALSSIALSISNVTGGELTGNTGAPVNVSPSTSQSPIGNSPSPAYGSFSDTFYDTDTPLANTTGISSVGNQKYLIAAGVGLVLLGVIAAFTKRRR